MDEKQFLKTLAMSSGFEIALSLAFSFFEISDGLRIQ